MTLLSKDQILTSDDLPSREVPVAEWGGDVLVRGLTATERDRFEFRLAAARTNPESVEVRAQVVGRCLVDAEGKRLFTDKEIVKLGAKSAAPVDRIFDVALELSGMGPQASDKASEDFGDAPSDASPSA